MSAAEQRRCEVREHDHPDDLTETHRGDGDIVAAHPEHRKPEEHADGHRHQDRKGQSAPEGKMRNNCIGGERVRAVRREQRHGIGSDCEERHEAEIEQPRQPDLEIQSHAHQRVEPDLQ